jgi:hypothetical protein
MQACGHDRRASSRHSSGQKKNDETSYRLFFAAPPSSRDGGWTRMLIASSRSSSSSRATAFMAKATGRAEKPLRRGCGRGEGENLRLRQSARAAHGAHDVRACAYRSRGWCGGRQLLWPGFRPTDDEFLVLCDEVFTAFLHPAAIAPNPMIGLRLTSFVCYYLHEAELCNCLRN